MTDEQFQQQLLAKLDTIARGIREAPRSTFGLVIDSSRPVYERVQAVHLPAPVYTGNVNDGAQIHAGL
jgi:hypothetical protein